MTCLIKFTVLPGLRIAEERDQFLSWHWNSKNYTACMARQTSMIQLSIHCEPIASNRGSALRKTPSIEWPCPCTPRTAQQ